MARAGYSSWSELYWKVIGTIRWRIHHTRAWVWRRLLWRTTVVAIIGSCAKTTTKEIVRNLTAELGSTTANLGSWSGLRFGGIADAILRTRLGDSFLVVEAGIEKPGEMTRISSLLRPDIIVVTKIAPAHLSYFDGLDHIAAEKGIIVEQCGKNDIVILNRDDERVFAMKELTSARIVTYGFHPESDFVCSLTNSVWPSRLSISVRCNTGSEEIQSRFVGEHWSVAILAAVAVGRTMGVPLSRCAELVEQQEPVWARMQPIELPSGVTFIRDDYHGSPHNFQTAFDVIRTATAARKVLVSTSYSNVQGRSRDKMRTLANDAHGVFDIFVVLGEGAKYAKNALKDKGIPAEAILATNSILEIVEFLKQRLKPGDLVLLKGKTSAHISRAYLGLLGDMSCELSECTQQILCDRCPKLGFPWTEELKPFIAPPDCYL